MKRVNSIDEMRAKQERLKGIGVYDGDLARSTMRAEIIELKDKGIYPTARNALEIQLNEMEEQGRKNEALAERVAGMDIDKLSTLALPWWLRW